MKSLDPGRDVWATLGHTASMSPDERARRGLTPPSPVAEPGESSGPEDSESERVALAPTGAAPLAADRAAAAALPIEDGARYELEGVHARGGLGRVVRAHDRLLRRTVAIKELLQRSPAAQARFMREALITARLQHPGIVPVHEAGRWPSGDPYYSMKLVSGRTLKELIQSKSGLDQRLALLPHVLAVAETIAYAHSQNVIHRDIKPANVIVGDFGETVVVDWGLAKDLSRPAQDDLPIEAGSAESGAESADAGAGPAATAAGHVMGTPSYMAPEQARGDTIDARADVYSLGAMLYELLAGEPPHTGESADKILKSALTSLPVPIELRQPAAPPDLVAIVHKAMARRQGDRYRSAIELAEDIRRFQTGQLVTARHYSTRTLLRRWIARRRAVVGVAAAAALALALTGALSFQRVVAQRNLAETRRDEAQRAEQAAVDRRHEMAFLQAEGWLARDPTAALAWLKTYPASGKQAERLGAMVDEALELGVARHVLRQPTWVMGVGFTDGGRAAVGVLKSGEVLRWDVETGTARMVGRHSETVRVAALSPDGSLVAVGGAGGTVELFALDRDDTRHRLPGHGDEVTALGFSADGRRLATGSMDRAVRVWDVARARQAADSTSEAPLLAVDKDPVNAAAMSFDGQSLFVGLLGGEVMQIAVPGGARRRLAGLDKPAYALAPSPDGKHLAAQYGEGVVALIDRASGEVREVGLLQSSGKGSWGFSPTGRYLTAASLDGTIRLYEVATGKLTELRGHEDAIYQLAFSADESVLLSASDDVTARVWDLRTSGVRVLRGHDDDITFAALSPDGRTAVTGGLDSSIRLWQLGGSQEPSEVVGRIGDLGPPGFRSTLSEDGRLVLSPIAGERLQTWDLVSDEKRQEGFDWIDRRKLDSKHAHGPILGKGGRLLAFPQPDGRVALWDLLSGERRDLDRDGGAAVTALALSKDGSALCTCDADGLIQLWDLASGPDAEPRVLFRDRQARGAALSPDGKRLALAFDDRLELFELPGAALLTSVDLDTAGCAPSDQPRKLVFSRDGVYVAALSKAQSSLLLWNTSSGDPPRRVDIGGHEVHVLAFSPDSSRLALAMSDRTVLVVETAAAQTRLLEGHRDMVWHVAWSPDGTKLASASYDRTIRLWNLDSGGVRVLRGHGGSVEAVAFSADGKDLTSASADGTVRRWHLDRLPDDSVTAVPQRLEAATTAVMFRDGRAATRAAWAEPERAREAAR